MAIRAFVCYAHADNALKDEFLHHLAALRDRLAVWHDRQIGPGEDWVGEIDARLDEADLIVLLASADFAWSKYCQDIECKRALERHRTGRARVVPVLLRPFAWEKTELALLQFLPRAGKAVTESDPRDSAWAEVVRELEGVVEELEAGRPLAEVRRRPAGWRPAGRYFTGREKELALLAEALHSRGRAILCGLPGVGKTELARAWVERSDREVVFWADAWAPDVLRESLGAIARQMGLAVREEADAELVAAGVRTWFERHDDWLLVIDGAADWASVAEWTPSTGRGHIVVTARGRTGTADAAEIPLASFDAGEGALFLLRRTGRIPLAANLEAAGGDDRRAAEAISQALGGLPLGLEQAGAFIAATRRSLGEYLDLYLRRGAELRARETAGPAVAKVLGLALEELEADNPAAAALVRACAWLGISGIPEEVFAQAAAVWEGPLSEAAGDEIAFADVVGRAAGYSLLERDAEGRTLAIHRLVADTVRDLQGEEQHRAWSARALSAVDSVLPWAEDSGWRACVRLVGTGARAAALAEEAGAGGAALVHVWGKLGNYLRERASYREAVMVLERALARAEQEFGANHAETASALYRLSAVERELGRLDRADHTAVLSLAASAAAFGPESWECAKARAMLGLVRFRQGRYGEADTELRRAWRVFEQEPDRNWRELAAVGQARALVADRQWRFPEAEELHKATYELYRKKAGLRHLDTLTALHNLACHFEGRKEFEKAAETHVEVLRAFEEELEPGHPLIAMSQNALGTAVFRLGEFRRAEQWFRKALEIREEALGAEHPETATTLGNLAEALRAQGRAQEALPLCQRALRIRARVLGAENPETAIFVHNLALILVQLDRKQEAAGLLDEASRILEATLGAQHPQTKACHAQLVRVRNELSAE